MEQGARSGAPLNTPTGQPTNIKAIPTRYKGYHFRSRLEARWAVAFDAMDLEWDYEPQGFEVSRGPYLPDFWLPGIDKWIEIKASPGRISHKEWGLMQDFGNEVAMPESKFSILFGIPDPRTVKIGIHPTVVWVGADAPVDWGAPGTDRMLVDSCGHVRAGFIPGVWLYGAPEGMRAACAAARSARFEHGHSGIS
jgi:hypothetical protein